MEYHHVKYSYGICLTTIEKLQSFSLSVYIRRDLLYLLVCTILFNASCNLLPALLPALYWTFSSFLLASLSMMCAEGDAQSLNVLKTGWITCLKFSPPEDLHSSCPSCIHKLLSSSLIWWRQYSGTPQMLITYIRTRWFHTLLLAGSM